VLEHDELLLCHGRYYTALFPYWSRLTLVPGHS
jgi:hypothetical protein